MDPQPLTLDPTPQATVPETPRLTELTPLIPHYPSALTEHYTIQNQFYLQHVVCPNFS